ncbi:hypothetical protein [Lysinibacillus sp. FSL K6-4013]|uniref:hypothetical protein n=1 Tax=Lysinibacillus sp. FSL K6-4013 TaxID=2921504 RepID=UPI00315B3F79
MAEKSININGKEVKFKITGGTPVHYLSLFGKDFLAEFIALEKDMNAGTLTDFMPFYRIAWLMAKKADESIPQLDEWLDSFEDGFPVIDLLQELMPLIQANFKSNLNKPKPKKK